MQTPSYIFTGFRALGFVSNHVPLCVRYHKKHRENYVVTCVGKAFHVYNCSKLGIITVSNTHPEQIGCSAVDGRHTYTASGTYIQAYAKRKQVVHTYKGHDRPVVLLLPFGIHLISVDDHSSVKVWEINTEDIFLELNFENESFEVTSIVHPNTYVNKVLFGSRQGTLQLWNLRTNKQLHNFTGWDVAITVLQQAPAVDVIAIGLADGRAVLHNIRYDETVMTFTQDWGPVTAISFRTDGHPIMATGSTLGHIALWNLENKKLQSQIRDAHNGAVTGLHCLPSEPLMVTSSPANSLKMWIFDMPDGGGRMLNQRNGHSAPPSRACFYGNRGHDILSAGQDSALHSFSTVHDSFNKSLGRASYVKKGKKSKARLEESIMPPITAFAAEPSRQSDWDSIVACHRGEKRVTTWNYSRSTVGAYKLLHERFKDERLHKQVSAQCVDISSCGNFIVVGYNSGHVDKYNMQSGIHRGSYGDPAAHKGSVRGVVIDGLNQITVSAGADKCVHFWRFKNHDLLETVKLDSQVAQVLLHRESAMLAVSTDDFQVIIIDTDTRRIVRRFSGHANILTDMAFSADSRWLITSSMDGTVRTWDVPTGRLIDCFMVDCPVTSLALSPTSDFLVTTHIDDLGLYLWSNMTLYRHVNLKPLALDYEPVVMALPSTGRLTSGLAEDKENEEDSYEESDFKSPEQISDELVTLSLLPNSRWLGLINLDVIKQRNKPKQPPKVPKSAPFFLPTIAGLQPKFAVEEQDKSEETKRIIPGDLHVLTQFGKCLQASAETQDFEPVLAALKDMGPSAIDLELRSLSPEGGGSVDLMKDFLVFITASLKTNRNFELIQAYLGLFLKLHGDTISREAALIEVVSDIQDAEKDAWTNIQTLFNQSSCLVNYMKSAVL